MRYGEMIGDANDRAVKGRREWPGAEGILSLAAAPAFAVMAVITWTRGSPGMPCSVEPDGSLIGGMVPMYAMMAVFHASPWLRLIARRGRSAGG